MPKKRVSTPTEEQFTEEELPVAGALEEEEPAEKPESAAVLDVDAFVSSAELVLTQEVAEQWLSHAYMRKTDRYTTVVVSATLPKDKLNFLIELAVSSLKMGGMIAVPRGASCKALSKLVEVPVSSLAAFIAFKKSNN